MNQLSNCQTSRFQKSSFWTKFVVAGMLVLFALDLSASQAKKGHFSNGHRVKTALYLLTVQATFNLNDPPDPGDQALFNREVYEADMTDPMHPFPVGDAIGSNIVICTVAGVAGLLCNGSLTLFGKGTMTMSGPFTFENPTDVAVTGGTGKYRKVSGSITAFELNPQGDQIYHVDIWLK